jgi:heat shock protein HslJ
VESNLEVVAIDEIVDISWQWAAQYVREPASQSVVPDPQSYTILFKSDGSFTVQADCNSGIGTYSEDGSSIDLTLGAFTEAECDPDSLSKTYIALLAEVGSFGMQEGVLVLVSQDGSTQISFTNGGPAGSPGISLNELSPLAQEALVDIQWQLTTVYETGSASQVPIPDPQDYSVIFREDGSLEIKADCNSALGTYQISNDQMSITLGTSTLIDCGAESLANDFQEWLGLVNAFGGRESSLVLVSGDEASYLEFQNAGEATLEPQTCAWVDLRSLKIDAQGLSAATQTHCLPGTPFDDTQPPAPRGLPEHVQILFDAALSPEQVEPNDPILYIIPVSEYKQQWNASGNPAVANAIEELSSLLRSQSEDLAASGMPVLPYERLTGLNDLAVQAQFLDIPMGYGVRFVGRFAEDPVTVTNDDPQLFYIFLGFSDDGRYLISFFYPVSTDNLPNVADVSDEERAAAENNYQRYLEGKVEGLNALEPSAWDPDLTVLDGVIGSLNFEYAAPTDGPGLTDNLWLWSGLVMTDPANRSVIPNPQNYTLVFFPDGSLNIVADCNSGMGSYTLIEEVMSIEVGLITRTSCERRSLSEQFVTLLVQASAYRFDQNQLVITLGEDTGSMLLIFGGPVISLPDVSEEAARVTALEVINVRSGPGVQYPSYGVAPAGIRAEVVGVSADGKWWVVKVPADYAADEQGWISAEFVDAFNVAGVPVIPIPELGEIELVAPEEGKPTATALEPVNVRRGPGVQYPSFGIAPLDAKMEIVGVSPDGLWWVVKIPTTLDPEGQGWVSADFVTATNTQNVPAIAPPLP